MDETIETAEIRTKSENQAPLLSTPPIINEPKPPLPPVEEAGSALKEVREEITEKIKTDSHEVRLRFDEEGLKRLIESDEWKDLEPNVQRENALLPRDLSTKDILQIISAMPNPRSVVVEKKPVPFKKKEIPGVGTLEYLGNGYQKIGYRFTDMSGRDMVVLSATGYNMQLTLSGGANVSPYSEYRSTDGDTHTLYSYSDFRRYLSAPVAYDDHNAGIFFEEYGGEPLTSLPESLRNRAIRRVFDYATECGLEIVDPEELFNPKHYLGENGVFDIPLIDTSKSRKSLMKKYSESANGSPELSEFLAIAKGPRILRPLREVGRRILGK